MSGKTKFSLYRDSYDAEHGAVSAGKPDYGRNKIDCFVYDKDCESMTAKFIAAMQERPFQYAFLHYADPDAAGHAHGWGGDAYQQAIRKVDGQLGRLFQLIESQPTTSGQDDDFPHRGSRRQGSQPRR